MRKYVRHLLRRQAERIGVKPSRFVRSEFDRLQIKKQGRDKARINQLKGTHKRKLWRSRIINTI